MLLSATADKGVSLTIEGKAFRCAVDTGAMALGVRAGA